MLAAVNKKLSFLMAAMAFLLAACQEYPPQPEPMSRILSGLAYDLKNLDSCEKSAPFIQQWLAENRVLLQDNKEDFDSSCRPGKKSDFTCMAFQILASARIEVALKPCEPTDELQNAVDLLNQRAGIGVRIGKLSP